MEIADSKVSAFQIRTAEILESAISIRVLALL
jgi:hypothetical protein